MKRLVFVLLILPLLLRPLPAPARGILASPVQLGLVAPPGGAASDVVKVSSSKEEKNRIRALLLDFTKDEMGRIQVLPDGQNPRSCKGWLSVDQADFLTPETGSVEVRVTAHLPPDARGSYWALLALEVMPPPRTEGGGTGVVFVPRVAIPVIVTAAGTEEPSLQVEGFRAAYNGAEVVTELAVRNTGNSALLLKGAFTLERPAAPGSLPEEAASQEPDPATSYPGSLLRVRGKLALPLPEPGLTAHAYFRYGPSPAQAVEAASEVEGLPAAVPEGGRLAPPAPNPSPQAPKEKTK